MHYTLCAIDIQNNSIILKAENLEDKLSDHNKAIKY